MEKRSLKNIAGMSFGILLMTFLSMNFVSALKLDLNSVLASWWDSGIFEFLLPFLLVFALIFGILTKVTILGDNKAVHAIIAAALGLLSLTNLNFRQFIMDFSPNLAIGITVLLAGIILLGLFWDPAKDSKTYWIIYVLFGLGVLIFVLVTAGTFTGGGFVGGNLWNDYGSAFITLLIVVGIIWAIVGSGKKGGSAGHP